MCGIGLQCGWFLCLRAHREITKTITFDIYMPYSEMDVYMRYKQVVKGTRKEILSKEIKIKLRINGNICRNIM